ncbi:MAG: ATP-binding protein [Anaerolineales bacterium]|nr:ATP-binding protein [Anaerolineales bacterium]
MFLTDIVDKGGNVNLTLPTTRTRLGEHGPEYVIAWGSETQSGKDIVITRVDIDNLLRAKAAIYAGFSVLATSIGFPLEAIERVLIGGSFGKYINVEKAVQIGLLPDLPWEQFHFLGNTSVLGAYLALIDQQARARIADIAGRMTYVELSADNSFYEAFTSALFLPHTDLHRFPSVAAALAQESS